MKYKSFTPKSFLKMYESLCNYMQKQEVMQMTNKDLFENYLGIKYTNMKSRTVSKVISDKYNRILLHYGNVVELVNINTYKKVEEALDHARILAAAYRDAA